MLKTLLATLSFVQAQQYGQPAYAPYGAPAQPSYHAPQQQYGNHNYQAPAYGHKVEFKKPGSVMDKKYYQDVLSTFKQCKAHKCDVLGRGYSTGLEESLSTLGAYTSCVTACSAEITLKALADFKRLLSELNDIGFHKLVLARKYISGEGEYDVLAHATNIDGSCCLPDDYFATWDRIMIRVQMEASNSSDTFKGASSSDDDDASNIDRMMSVTAYLQFCTKSEDTPSGWRKEIRVRCDERYISYLELIQRNVGHLVLAPKCDQLAPTGACSADSVPNARASNFPDDVCVAKKCVYKGKTEDVEIPLIKAIAPANHWHESCPDDTIIKDDSAEDEEQVVYTFKYERVVRKNLKYYVILGGLPSFSAATPDTVKAAIGSGNVDALGSCTYDQGLVQPATDDDDLNGDARYSTVSIDEAAIHAAKVCPYGGLFEYCNMRQFASYLQKQLFDNDDCQVVDMRSQTEDLPQYYGTLACLYKITTLKCDCMEAVLNCYEREFHFTQAISQTIGKAASILCGFLLCQRPNVYSLFGGQEGISKSQIMRELLTNVGVAVPDMDSLPPATFAFLAFGLGMVAFITVKSVAKKSIVSAEDGYRNLI